jgi:hypothetical protein
MRASYLAPLLVLLIPGSLPAKDLQYRDVAAALVTVRVGSSAAEFVTAGSGALIGEGLVLTAAEIIHRPGVSHLSIVLADGTAVSTELTKETIALDSSLGAVVILRIDSGAAGGLSAPLGTSRGIEPNERLFVAAPGTGNPPKLLAGKARFEKTNPFDYRIELGSVKGHEGLWGAPILNARGEIAGIVSQVLGNRSGSERWVYSKAPEKITAAIRAVSEPGE